MKILVEILFVLIASIISTIYISWDSLKEINFETEKANIIKCFTKKKILYFIISILSGTGLIIMFNIVYIEKSMMEIIKLFTLIMLLFPCAWFDLKKYIIPNKVILFGLILRIVYYIPELIIDNKEFILILKDNIIAVVVMILFLVVSLIVVRTGLGFGDVKLLIMMAFYQGLTGIIGNLFFSLLIAFFASLFLLMRKKKKRKDTIPFAPFILMGTYISAMLTGL